MASFADNMKTCGVCLLSLASGQGQALFTAECSHCFHFSCVGHYRHCPVCNAAWTHPPLVAPPPNNLHPFSFPMPQIPHPFYFPTPQFSQFSRFECQPEPDFFDDEPIPDAVVDPMSVDSSQKVTVRAIPERSAVAAAESISPFSVLVALKAPPLSDEARSSQRAPLDIVTVLDVSGSMTGMKLLLVKRAVNFVIDNLGVCDRLSIVSFSDQATRLLPLIRMTDAGREEAKRAVSQLHARGGTNIVEGLKKGAKVLEQRRFKNPVTSIIFLSDGNDTYNHSESRNGGGYLHLLPPSINPRKQGLSSSSSSPVLFPVHSFGFGSDHDPITMHAISDSSGGTFSFIESYEMVQDAFASCIGGLMSVVTHELCIKLRSASHGVEIKSIPSGRYRSAVSNQGALGLINVGELYADEEKEFIINLSIPVNKEGGKTSVLDITCSYRDAASKEAVDIEGDLVEIRRPEAPTAEETAVNIEVDRQRNRVRAAESIEQAQKMAEAGDLRGARDLLAKNRDGIMGSAAGKAGDGLVRWLEGEMKETETRMGNAEMYQQSGRAFAMAGMSAHASQRATSRGNMVAGAMAMGYAPGSPGGMAMGCGAPAGAAFGGYATPQMATMVKKSKEKTMEGEGKKTQPK